MFFKLHDNASIGYKLLTDADLGRDSRHQTHIGLFENTLNFIVDFHQQSFAQFIYENEAKELLMFLDPITNPDGTPRSPKIRSGNDAELDLSGTKVNSIVREIRAIATEETDYKWYLMWFGLDNEDIVFFLFKENSSDHSEIIKHIGTLGTRGIIEKKDKNFIKIINFLNAKINNANTNYLEELEILAQLGTEDVLPTRRIKPRPRDIERANELFRNIGRKGEELINSYLSQQKSIGQVANFQWMNKDRESGMPYDFEISFPDNNFYYSDVKATTCKFEGRMIFSNAEMRFITQNSNYFIQRVYDINNHAKLKECHDLQSISGKFIEHLDPFNKKIEDEGLKINEIKIAIPSTHESLEIGSEILI